MYHCKRWVEQNRHLKNFKMTIYECNAPKGRNYYVILNTIYRLQDTYICSPKQQTKRIDAFYLYQISIWATILNKYIITSGSTIGRCIIARKARIQTKIAYIHYTCCTPMFDHRVHTHTEPWHWCHRYIHN